MNALRSKISQIPYFKEKGRFLVFVLFIVFVLFVAYYLFRVAYARYELRSSLVSDIDKALYIFESDEIRFNLDPAGIIPSNTPYTYRFSVANFNDDHDSDVDISYTVTVRTTTNLPITVSMYRNELPSSPGAVNLLTGSTDVQDEDGAWYHVYSPSSSYSMYYANETTDYYTLVINFPINYANDLTYVNSIENIEITLASEQMV